MMRRKPKLQQAWASDLEKLKEQNHKTNADAFFFLILFLGENTPLQFSIISAAGWNI